MTTTPTTMRAAVYDGPRSVTVRPLPLPEPDVGEVVVQVERCGICGSDLHLVVEGWGSPGSIYGHEWSGRVAAVGAGVDGWQAGDRVVGGPTLCGQCRWCRSGRPALCVEDPLRTGKVWHTGGYAEYHLVPASSLHRVPEGMDMRTAALSEPLAVALHALRQAGIPVGGGPRVLVTGAGPIGLLVVAAAAAVGVTDLVVSEPSALRRERALAAGAGTAVAPEDLPEPPASPTQCHDDAFDVALDCSGRARAIGAALGLLAPAGRLVLVGTGSPSVRVDPVRILFNELVVTGSYCYDDGGIDDALALLAAGRLPTDVLLHDEDFPLDRLLDAMQRLASGELPAKVLVRP